jgi:hypothetical protein
MAAANIVTVMSDMDEALAVIATSSAAKLAEMTDEGFEAVTFALADEYELTRLVLLHNLQAKMNSVGRRLAAFPKSLEMWFLISFHWGYLSVYNGAYVSIH